MSSLSSKHVTWPSKKNKTSIRLFLVRIALLFINIYIGLQSNANIFLCLCEPKHLFLFVRHAFKTHMILNNYSISGIDATINKQMAHIQLQVQISQYDTTKATFEHSNIMKYLLKQTNISQGWFIQIECALSHTNRDTVTDRDYKFLLEKRNTQTSKKSFFFIIIRFLKSADKTERGGGGNRC